MAEYNKPWLSIDEQVGLLTKRGLADASDFRHEIETIGYYRLSGYWYIFRRLGNTDRREDQFFEDATMAHVVKLYGFDERLRSAVWEAASQIELALRTQMGYQLGKVDPFIHLDPTLLDPSVRPESYQKLRTELVRAQDRSHDDFVVHFRRKYDGRLPIWVVTEIMQFGQFVHLFDFAPYSNRVAIASTVGARADEYHSWLKSINIVRNIAAHHGRLWNRSIGMKPMLHGRKTDPLLMHAVNSANRVYGVTALIAYLLRHIGAHKPIATLRSTLESLPDINGVRPQSMGMPEGWAYQDLWRVES